MGIRAFFVGLLLCGFLAFLSERASAASEWIKFDPIWECNGTCAATIFVGPRWDTDFTDAYGLRTPPWKYTYGNSWFLGGALSHGLVEFSDLAAFEGEIGFGQRFGSMHESEVWAALYFRWKSFPWNKYLITTVAVSTGLSYASGISQYEIEQSVVGYGSNLLHYFSPEITFALPSSPDWELIVRTHHRSGGGMVWGYTPLFKGVWGGSQYLVAGIRHRF